MGPGSSHIPSHSPSACVCPQEELVNNTELVQSYRQQISNVVNQANLQLFWNMYNRCGCPHPPWAGAGQAAPFPQLVDELVLKSES